MLAPGDSDFPVSTRRRLPRVSASEVSIFRSPRDRQRLASVGKRGRSQLSAVYYRRPHFSGVCYGGRPTFFSIAAKRASDHSDLSGGSDLKTANPASCCT